MDQGGGEKGMALRGILYSALMEDVCMLGHP